MVLHGKGLFQVNRGQDLWLLLTHCVRIGRKAQGFIIEVLRPRPNRDGPDGNKSITVDSIANLAREVEKGDVWVDGQTEW